jgi:hypothetical protein
MQSAIGTAPTLNGMEVADEIDVTVKVPSLGRLLRWPPERLIDARDYGLDWRVKAYLFIQDPSSEAKRRAEVALEEYVKRIRRLSPSAPHVELSVKAFASKIAPGLATAALGLAAPSAGPYVATMAASGYIAYQYLIKGRHVTASVRFKSNVLPAGNGNGPKQGS